MLGNVLFKYIGRGKSMPTVYTTGTVYFDANTNTLKLAISESEVVPFPDLSGITATLSNLSTIVERLDGDKTVEGSVKYQIAQLLDGVSEDFDTFKEIATWINEHGATAAAMAAAINTNTADIAELKAKECSIK